MAKQVNVPPELEAAADCALDLEIPANKAKDLFRYVYLTRAVKRAGGNEAAAALKLGMSRSALNQAIALLHMRVA